MILRKIRYLLTSVQSVTPEKNRLFGIIITLKFLLSSLHRMRLNNLKEGCIILSSWNALLHFEASINFRCRLQGNFCTFLFPKVFCGCFSFIGSQLCFVAALHTIKSFKNWQVCVNIKLPCEICHKLSPLLSQSDIFLSTHWRCTVLLLYLNTLTDTDTYSIGFPWTSDRSRRKDLYRQVEVFSS
jgi:hypothetical protein